VVASLARRWGSRKAGSGARGGECRIGEEEGTSGGNGGWQIVRVPGHGADVFPHLEAPAGIETGNGGRHGTVMDAPP